MNPISLLRQGRTLISALVGCIALTIGLLAAPAGRAQEDPFREKNRKPDPTPPLLQFDRAVSPKEPKPRKIGGGPISGNLEKGPHTTPHTQRLPDQRQN